MLLVGDPVPWFVTKSNVNATFHFDTVAGRYVILSFFGSADSGLGEGLLREVYANTHIFDTTNLIFCGVSNNATDEARMASAPSHPGIIFVSDLDLAIARGYGLIDELANPPLVRPTTFVLDEGLRILAVIPIEVDASSHVARVAEVIRRQPILSQTPRTAPVLILDRVFEPQLCRELVGIYEATGGYESGFMREVEGKTTGIIDNSFKRRSDCELTDGNVIHQIHLRLHRRVIPEIKKAYNFIATRIERHIVACYDAQVGAHFRPHRDNTTLGTAHRRFAVSINLNSEEFEGGNLRFPEFGPRVYRPTTGGAVVFGCSLLHEVTPLTRGRRFAFLPFLYDDAAAAIRENNKKHISGEFINLNKS